MPVTAESLNLSLSQTILGRVFVGSIENIRNELLFSGFIGNESDRGTKKSPENPFSVLFVPCSNSFPMKQEKNQGVFVKHFAPGGNKVPH